MNVVFVLGNGFDLNLGFNTSYSDFYKYYLEQDESIEIIKELKNNIESDIENWSDLELRLGSYTSTIKDQDEFDAVYFSIVDSLRNYLNLQQDDFDYSKLDMSVLLRDLAMPERVLSQKHRNKLTEWHDRFPSNIHTKILTFNYTRTIEKILGEKINIKIGEIRNKNILFSGIEHIHGYVDDNLVLGVNDIEQIWNEELRLSQEVVEAIVKPSHNQELGHMRDDRCLEIISSANLIFVFGSSIGKTDKMWWENIGDRLGDNCRLVIFHRGNVESKSEILHARLNREIIDKFLSLTRLNKEEQDVAKEYIFAVVTKDLFNLFKSIE